MKKTTGSFTEKQLARLDKISPIGFRAGLHKPGNQEQAATLFDKNVMKRQASLKREASGNYSFMMGGAAGVMKTPLLYVDPLFDPVLLLFPTNNLVQLNKRLRHYYTFHYLVGSIIDCHSEFPLSDFQFECDDYAIKKYYNDFKERVGLLEILTQQLRGYHLLGESIHYGNWDNNNFEWEGFTQLQPEDVELMDTFVSNPLFYLKIKKDSDIGKLVQSKDPVDQKIVELMPQKFVSAAKTGRRLMLEGSRVLYFANKPDGSMRRGNSIVKRCLKDLVQEDRLRLLQQAYTERHTRPIKIFKVGSKELGWIPSDKHFRKLQTLLASASNDPDFNVIYHPFLEVDYVGTADKIAHLGPEFDDASKKIMTGLFANDALIHGDATTYASSTVQLKIIMFRYLTQRAKLEQIHKQQTFMQLSIKRGFIRRTKSEIDHGIRIQTSLEANLKKEGYLKVKGQDRVIEAEYIKDTAGRHVTGADGRPIIRIGNSVYHGYEYDRYIIPQFMWQKRNLVDTSSERDLLKSLRDNDEIPFEMLADSMGWDKKRIDDMMKNEQSTNFDKRKRKLYDEKADSDKDFQKNILSGKSYDYALKEEAKKEETKTKSKTDSELPDDTEEEPKEEKPISPEEGDKKPETPVGGEDVIE